MYFSSNTLTAITTLLSVGTCLNLAQAADNNNNNQNNNNQNNYIITAQGYYSPDYLATLSDAALKEALRPKILNNGLEIVQMEVGNGELQSSFVYMDTRRKWSMNNGTQLTLAPVTPNYIEYTKNPRDLTKEDQEYWFRESIDRWFRETQCVSGSGKDNTNVIQELDDDEIFDSTTSKRKIGLFERLFSTGVFDDSLVVADIRHVGFLSKDEFPHFAYEPNQYAVTFTVNYVDGGHYTDIDGDGKHDAAFTEIYYNDDWTWTVNETIAFDHAGDLAVDLASVALHEAGHSLGVDHFGQCMYKVQKKGFSCTPSAIMNPISYRVDRHLGKGDSHGFCSQWEDSLFLLD